MFLVRLDNHWFLRDTVLCRLCVISTATFGQPFWPKHKAPGSSSVFMRGRYLKVWRTTKARQVQVAHQRSLIMHALNIISSFSLQREPYSLSVKSLIKLHFGFSWPHPHKTLKSHPRCHVQAMQVFKNDALKYCAARVAGHSGDVRKALQWRTWTGQKHVKNVSCMVSVGVSLGIHVCVTIWKHLDCKLRI